MVLSTAYLGNIRYYSKLASGRAVIDIHENYQKQSYRNRTEIMTAAGVTPLVIPVLTPSGEKTRVCDLRIDNTKRWQHRHWHAIFSAYGNSPYFFHYGERLEPFYKKPYEFLVDFNMEIQETVLELLRIAVRPSLSVEYLKDVPPQEDLRTGISPKPHLRSDDPDFRAPVYYQVFSESVPFAENLSIVDLLFCEGPAAAGILRESICGNLNIGFAKCPVLK